MIPEQYNGIKDPTNKFSMHRKKLFSEIDSLSLPKLHSTLS